MSPGLSWLDVKLGLRMLIKYPGLTLVGGLGMAVSIGIGSGFFAFFNSHLHPRLPLDEGDRIVALENWNTEVNNEERQALHDFVTWRAEMASVQDINAFRDVAVDLVSEEGVREPVRVAQMTAGAFRVARVPPLLGRYLVEDDELPGAPPVLVIGYEEWQARFAGDPSIVARPLRLGGTVYTVVGVMPEAFRFPMDHGFWSPLRADSTPFERGEGPEIFVFGRLAPGVTMEEAQVELTTLGRRAAAAYPDTHAVLRPQVLPYTYPLIDIQDVDSWEVVSMQLVMSVLLIVVALNVAVLVYARTAMRRGEIAVRSALGASRRRVIVQLFVEALVFASGAAAVGLALAHFGLRQGNLIMETEIGVPFWSDYGLRSATVFYTLGLTLAAAVLVGVVPAVQSTGRTIEGQLRELGTGTGMRLGRTWTALIVTQVAVVVAALPSAANFGLSHVERVIRPAFPAEEFVATRVTMEPLLPAGADEETLRREAAARFDDGLLELMQRLEREPDVAGVTFTSSLPGRGGRIQVEAAAASAEAPATYTVSTLGVDLAYFEVFGANVLAGRRFDARDLGAAASAVVVSRGFAQRILAGDDVLGTRIRHVADPTAGAGGSAQASPAEGPWLEIVGVVDDLYESPFRRDSVPPIVYYPVSAAEIESAGLAVRLRGPTPTDFMERLQRITAAVDRDLKLGRVATMADFERQEQLATRLIALVLVLIIVSAFLLSGAGVYALMSFTVTQRRREMGIRTALGARPRQLLRGVFARAARQIGTGVVIGVVGAALVDRMTGGDLLGGRAVVLLPSFALLMAAVGVLAALGPAWCGLKVQPTEALRADV